MQMRSTFFCCCCCLVVVVWGMEKGAFCRILRDLLLLLLLLNPSSGKLESILGMIYANEVRSPCDWQVE